jgi:hypothetical protein
VFAGSLDRLFDRSVPHCSTLYEHPASTSRNGKSCSTATLQLVLRLRV